MKKIYLIICFLGLGLGLHAQQDSHYSQYMFNHLAINPAYAGSWNFVTANLIYRKQWVDVAGAPTTQSFTLHGPSRNERHGFGLSFYNDRIGVTRSTNINLGYAYRILFNNNVRLSFGLQGTVENFNADFTSVTTGSGIQNGILDPTFGQNLNLWMPNVGAGALFYSNHFYLSLSAPDLLENQLGENTAANTEARHFFASTGFRIGAEDARVKFLPSLLLKYQPNSPIGLDLNAQFLLADKVYLGASYRLEDAVVGMFQWQASSWLRLGYAYDYPLNTLGAYTSGSHEFLLGFDLNFQRKGMVSPRWF